MDIDRRFALVTDSGCPVFPVLYRNPSTGRTYYRLMNELQPHTFEHWLECDSIEEVVRLVLAQGWLARARTEAGSARLLNGLYGIGGPVRHCRLAPELSALARLRPGARAAEQAHAGRGAGTQTVSADAQQELDDLGRVADLTASRFAAALTSLEDHLTQSQRQMLKGHASAAGRAWMPGDLARCGGYARFMAANAQYGEVGKKIAAHFGIGRPGYWTKVLAEDLDEQPPTRYGRWTMRPQLAWALSRLGWMESVQAPGTDASIPEGINVDQEAAALAPFPDAAGSETVRQQLVDARVGQGIFRERMLQLWGRRCAVTGCALEAVLVASHALPWAQCTDEQRLDEYNGLPLVANLDRLFDRGLVGFHDDGRILVKPEVDVDELRQLGLGCDMRLRFVAQRHLPYLAAHRRHFGLS
jgi:hypothetical protein